MKFDNIKSKFPIFKQKIKGKPLIYLDSANSSQKPKAVIDEMSRFYETEFSNVGRSVHTLAVKATNKFEETRDIVKSYVNAQYREEIIFTKGATEAINLVASTYGEKFIKEGDEILVTELKKLGIDHCRIEGKDSNDWKLVDAHDVIVHIFHPEKREFYDLEKMWSEEIPKEKAMI